MPDMLDLAVVGAGPCGIAVGAAAAREGLDAILFDRGCVTQSLIGYPYYMTFFSTAQKLEIGGVPFTIPEPKPSRREALAYYRRVVEHHGIDVRQYEKVTEIEGAAGDFTVRTRPRGGAEARDDRAPAASSGGGQARRNDLARAAGSDPAQATFRARAVVVATGGFHEPNYLGVPGEDLPKVRHYYREPYPYYDQDVLVVGGGNSAVEAALEMFRNGVRVSLVHFLDGIDSGVKPWVVPDITNRVERGEIPAYWRHRVREIRPDSVLLVHEESGEEVERANDWVVAMTGWRSDSRLLRQLGVEIDPATGVPDHDPSTMETGVPGVFVAGVLAAGNDANKIFIENGREHGGLIVESLRAS